MSRIRLAEQRHRLSRAEVLRSILEDGHWHTSIELAQRVGHRFGAAILTIRTGEDGWQAWHIEKARITDSGSVWRYRFVGINPNPRRVETWKSKAQRLEAENRVLRAKAQLAGVAL